MHVEMINTGSGTLLHIGKVLVLPIRPFSGNIYTYKILNMDGAANT